MKSFNIKELLLRKNKKTVPKGWFVSEAGQSIIHGAWYVVIAKWDDVLNKKENPRHFYTEECMSYEIALADCIYQVNEYLKKVEKNESAKII